MAANPSEQSVLRSQEFYRLKRTVASPGDIYEIDVSTKALYIGPESDIAEVLVQYYNPESPNSVENAIVSLNGPFVGRLDVLLKTLLPQTAQPARMLASPVDIVDPAYAPGLWPAQRSFPMPVTIDLIAATQPLPDIPDVRADRTLRLPSVPFTTGREDGPDPDDGSTDLLIPIYGRRMVTITAVSSVEVLVSLYLVRLQPGISPTPRSVGQLWIPASIPAAPATAVAVIRASDAARQGITYNEADDLPTSYYIESDQPPNPPNNALNSYTYPAPLVRGMADLLYINIGPTPPRTAGVEATRYIDLFIKLSDRET